MMPWIRWLTVTCHNPIQHTLRSTLPDMYQVDRMVGTDRHHAYQGVQQSRWRTSTIQAVVSENADQWFSEKSY